MMTAHVSHNSGEQEWYSPAASVEAARRVTGGIDLDPASSSAANAVVRASQFYTRDDDGLSQPWSGRVWLNPPYAQRLMRRFCERLASDVLAGNVEQAITLTNNATETHWFAQLAAVADAVCFPVGRVRFWAPGRQTATPLQGQALHYFGPNVATFHAVFGQFGSTATYHKSGSVTAQLSLVVPAEPESGAGSTAA
jgi:phage N-6-adenine-methyltransferase